MLIYSNINASDIPNPFAVTSGSSSSSTLSGSITVSSGWNFISSPVDGSIDVALVATKCDKVSIFNNITKWFGPYVTSGTVYPGEAFVAHCNDDSTISFVGVNKNSSSFDMSSNILNAGKGYIPSSHPATAIGTQYAIVGTPVDTTVADVISAGANGVMIYDASI